MQTLTAQSRNEIETTRRYSARYAFHDLVVRPLLSGSSKTLRRSIFDILERLDGPIRSIIDISAGDDPLIAELGELFDAEIYLANDICIESLYKLRHYIPLSGRFIGTNFDALNLPENLPCFDLAIAKNVIHHMTSGREMEQLLSNLDRVSKNILVVDIEDPACGSWQGRAWKFYYSCFLHDQGHRFVRQQEFRDIINQYFLSSTIYFKTTHTSKGTFMLALISRTIETKGSHILQTTPFHRFSVARF